MQHEQEFNFESIKIWRWTHSNEFIYVLLTVRLSIILAIDQLHAQIFVLY